MRYFYFVSYFHPKGSGNVEMFLPYPCTKIEHIREVEELLNKNNSNEWSQVTNFILLRIEE